MGFKDALEFLGRGETPSDKALEPELTPKNVTLEDLGDAAVEGLESEPNHNSSGAGLDATKGESEDKKPGPPNEEHSDALEAESEAPKLTEEATKPVDNAKLKAKIKAEVLEELNLQQQLSSFSQQVNSDRKADIDSLEAKIKKAIDEAIKNAIATHGHSSTDVVKAVKAELKAEAEAERQKAEAEKPKGMPWPFSILYK